MTVEELRFKGTYNSKKEIYKEVKDAVIGDVALTDNAMYIYGDDWVLATMNNPITLKVVDRVFVTGRGYITVVNNPDALPIGIDCFVVKGNEKIPIRGVEVMMTLMTIPEPKDRWGILTNVETTGDYLSITNPNWSK